MMHFQHKHWMLHLDGKYLAQRVIFYTTMPQYYYNEFEIYRVMLRLTFEYWIEIERSSFKSFGLSEPSFMHK